MKRLLKVLGTITPSAILTVISPWYDAITGWGLIIDAWQPQLNSSASILGAFSVFMSYALFKDKSNDVLRKYLYGSLGAFAFLIVVCVCLDKTVGIFWHPVGFTLAFVWIGWSIIYAAIFIALSISLVLGTFLITRNEEKSNG